MGSSVREKRRDDRFLGVVGWGRRLVHSAGLVSLVVRRSPYTNVYHCCTQRTASQWLRSVFSDPIVYRYTGLRVFPYDELGLRYASFDGPLPERTFAAHLYVSYPVYLAIPKPDTYKAFFVMRDPRDAVVSWYYAARYSHRPVDPIPRMRAHLQGLDPSEGQRYVIDRLAEWGSFDVQRSWVGAAEGGDRVRLFRYEDLARDNRSFLRDLFDYLDVWMPKQAFARLCDRRGFAVHTGGRSQGEEDPQAHYRKGVAGDWRTHFDQATMDHFRRVTGDLLTVLGYEE